VDTPNACASTPQGNVGIGTSSPVYKLDVSVATNDPTTGTPAAGSFVQVAGGTTTVGNGPSVLLKNASGAKETFWRMSAVTTSGNNGDLVFNGYNGGATYPERLRITAAGNVGIGTTSPQSKASFLTTSVPASNPTWSDSWVSVGPNVGRQALSLGTTSYCGWHRVNPANIINKLVLAEKMASSNCTLSCT
jgi:hypothetical protein